MYDKKNGRLICIIIMILLKNMHYLNAHDVMNSYTYIKRPLNNLTGYPFEQGNCS